MSMKLCGARYGAQTTICTLPVGHTGVHDDGVGQWPEEEEAGMSEQTEGAEVEALPVTREIVPKGITVYPDGSSQEVHWDYTVLHAGRIVAQPRAAVVAARGAEGGGGE